MTRAPLKATTAAHAFKVNQKAILDMSLCPLCQLLTRQKPAPVARADSALT